MTENTQISEASMVELIKLSYQDYEYRHRTYWELTYKSIVAIVFLMAIPYFLSTSGIKWSFPLIVFPLISAIFTIISISILQSEALRLKATNAKYNALREMLSPDLKSLPLKNCLVANSQKNLFKYR